MKVNLLNFALLEKNNEKKTVTFEITNDKPNDNGWVNRTMGIDMRRFKKNRSVTMNHDDNLIIGKSVKETMEQVTKNRHRIISEMEFFQGSGGSYTDLAMEAYELIDQDMLVGASVELIPYEVYAGEEAEEFYKEDFSEAPPLKAWRETGMMGRKYMRESSLAKYSIVSTPANMDTLKIKNSISDNLKSHLTYNSMVEFHEDVFEKENVSELIFFKEKFMNLDNLLKANGIEVRDNRILFNGTDVAEERRIQDVQLEANYLAEKIKKQLQGIL